MTRILSTLTLAATVLASAPLAAQDRSDRSPNNPTRRNGEVRRLTVESGPQLPAARYPAEFRSLDGSGNNGAYSEWGAAGVELLRITSVSYKDGVATPAGDALPSARTISNECAAQTRTVFSADRISDMFWLWGQFLDHDIDLTPIAEPVEAMDIAIPAGDPWFDPAATGTGTIPLDRSAFNMVAGVRQQINEITAYIDGSNVYGSDEHRARALRRNDGSGRLKTSRGNLLPFNRAGLPNAPSSSSDFFLAGDFRANENAALTAMHTLWVREHNYWADALAEEDPRLTGEEIYQRAKAIVTAELQAITYREFLPVLLGRRALAPYRGYVPAVNAGIANIFSTAAYRVGHTMLSDELLRLGRDGEEIDAGRLPLARAFFNPSEITEHGIEPLLRGAAAHRAQEIDTHVVDAVRNFLFGPPGSGGFDLASLNIQRGRDHGLPTYNQTRRDLGLRPARVFADVNADPAVHEALAAVYDSVDDIDLWIGGLAEPHAPDALVGRTFQVVLRDQFERLRDGDRFFYEGYLPRDMVRLVERQSLARILRRNTGIGRELGNQVFRGTVR